MNKVSVIFPFYGDINNDRPKIAIESIKNQKGVNIEIIIAEVSKNPKLNKIFGEENISYIYPPFTNENNKNIFRPGEIRNHAIKSSSGKFIYATDGDIILPNDHYFEELISIMKSHNDSPLYRPSMRRLPLECFDEFNKSYLEKGIKESMKSLDNSKEFIANTPNQNIQMKVVKYKDKKNNEKVVLFTETDWEKYKSNIENIGQEPRFSTMTTHGGGTFFTKEQFEKIGGYSREFINWGQDDADIQWKLKELYGLIKIPKTSKLEVLHLDHPRGYFKREQWRENLNIQKIRRTSNIEDIIRLDKKNYNALK